MIKAFLKGLATKASENVAVLLWPSAAAIATVMTFFTVPAVTLSLNRWQVAACVLGFIFALAITAWLTRRAASRRRFHATQYGERHIWGSAQQRDGTVTTQINTDLVIKNLTTEPLHLIRARLVRPKLGEPITAMIYTLDGDAALLPPREAAKVRVFMVMHGSPAAPGECLSAVIAITDDEGHEQRIRMALRGVITMQPMPARPPA